ncbi:mRNA cap guanine-N7 methyltransferase [Polyrhizophydium stewartii]|uniref:mRNA cap guanine-N(7) methyltransferase n=1 Tax=Polyrhizophydium stewartii TaxID=2732419 RepID=A0ABR4N4F7_9FUNG|nr:mRNA cap guanine-N7 methyltransferase [Polyrhizophydium stewartii]
MADNSALVANHYNARPERGIDVRQESVILSLKNFNNWVKAVLIGRYARPGARAFDMCCGKGGDLQKWKRQDVSRLVGIDIAAVSVDQARARYEQSCRRFFPAAFHAADCFSPVIQDIIAGEEFDIVSIQFSLHYSFETEAKARAAIRNVASNLRSGGFFVGTIPNADWIYKRLVHTDGLEFGNSIYAIKFDTKTPSLFGHRYRFTLADAIDDCPEYLINFSTLSSIAAEHGLRPVLWKTFHQFYRDECIEHFDMLQRMRVFNAQGTVSGDEWEAAGIYSVFAFEKT